MTLKEALVRLKTLVTLRKQAYQQVFNKESIPAERVLRDLAKFCRAHKSCFHADPRVQSVLEGRREVWLRIQHQLELSNEDVWKIYGRTEVE